MPVKRAVRFPNNIVLLKWVPCTVQSYIPVFSGLAKIIFATYSNLEQYLHPQNDASDPANDPLYKKRPVAPFTHRQYPTTDRNFVQFQPDDRIYYNEEGLEEEDKKVVGTKIISASIGERRAEKVPLKEPVIYTLEHKSVMLILAM